MSRAFWFLIVVIIFQVGCINWQGVGNMSEDNMTVIKSHISSEFFTSWPMETITAKNDKKLINFLTNFSIQLNILWAPACNVFIVYITDKSNSDSVLYGYAFRDHWFWMNGVLMDDGYYVSFIIWKDYNCIKWYSYDPNNPSNLELTYDVTSDHSFLSDTVMPVILASASPSVQKDVWEAAKNLGNGLSTSSSTYNFGWTIIASQSASLKYYGYFCAKDYFKLNAAGNTPSTWGSSLLIQTR